jgi:hypothetical protein
MKNYFLIILFFSSVSLQASEMWVTTPSELTTKEKLHRLTEKPSDAFKDTDLISMHEALLSHPISNSDLKSLLSLEDEAQNLSLSGSFQVAFNKYEALLHKLALLPNVAGVEKITLTAKIRLAELADLIRQDAAEGLWREAHGWAPDAKLSSDIYSPNILRRFNSYNHTLRNRVIIVDAPVDSSVFVDGERLQLKDGHWIARVEPGKHQVCVLTPGALWEIQKIEAAGDVKQIPLKFEPKSAVSGTCDQPAYEGPSFSWNSKLLVEFNGGACERVFDGNKWYSAKGEPLEPAQQVSKSVESHDLKLDGFSATNEKSWISGLTHSPWFWIGAGVLVAGTTAVVIQGQQQSDTVVAPTNK